MSPGKGHKPDQSGALKVLIVDDDRDFASTVAEYLSERLQVVPIVETDPIAVFSLMNENLDIRLVLCDFRMPSMDGLEVLLKLKNDYPDILFIFITAFGTPELKLEALQKGAIRYFEKPVDLVVLAEEIQDILHQEFKGFGGHIENIRLVDIIQLIDLSRRTVELVIQAGDNLGRMFFIKGEMVHAVTGEITGRDAFFEIYSWLGGAFSLGSQQPCSERSIYGSWQALVMEATQRDDESDNDLPATDFLASLSEDLLGLDDDDESMAEEQDVRVAFDEDDLLIRNNPVDTENGEAVPGSAENSLRLFVDDFEVGNGDYGAGLNKNWISDILKDVVEKIMTQWGESKKQLAFDEVSKFDIKPSFVRNHLDFYFQQLVNQVIQMNVEPFDFNQPAVREALDSLESTLRTNMHLTRIRFRQIIVDAVLFEVARVVEPSIAIAQILMSTTRGEPEKLGVRLNGLLNCGILPVRFTALQDSFKSESRKEYDQKSLESLVINTIQQRSLGERYQDLRESLIRLFEICQVSETAYSDSIHWQTMQQLLQINNLEAILDYDRKRENSSRQKYTLDDFDLLMTGFLSEFEKSH